MTNATKPAKSRRLMLRVSKETALMAAELRKELPWWGKAPTLAARVETLIRSTWYELIAPKIRK